MKKIQLTKGMEALVDDEDFEHLNQWRWNYNSGYAHRMIGGRKNPKHVYMQDVIAPRMGLIGRIDHRDRNGLNNQRGNLRQATSSQNQANKIDLQSNRSGYKGVRWKEDRQKWQAYIARDGSQFHLGYFDSDIEAAKTYNIAALRMWGEHAQLNDI